MSTNLVPISDRDQTTTPAQFTGLTGEDIEVLKQTICKDATDAELRLFVTVCNLRRLNPFTGQIHFVKRRQWNARLNNGEGGHEEVASHQTGIDGYRLIAERTGLYGGPVGTWWCGPDGTWRDVWLEDTPPAAAKVAVQRKDFAQPSEAIARWKAYVQTKRGGGPNAMWARMDAEQLAKCAEALVLRKVFPEELSGIYTTDEMAQADNDRVDYQTGEVVEPPAIEAGSGLPGGRVCPKGVQAKTPHNHAYCEAQWAQMTGPATAPTTAPPGGEGGGPGPTSEGDMEAGTPRTPPAGQSASDPTTPEPNPQPTAAAGSGVPTSPPSQASPEGGDDRLGRGKRGPGTGKPGNRTPAGPASDADEQADHDRRHAAQEGLL